ncbi:hypothetical protein ME804_06780 [Lactobacillus delbrueckii]|uniref:hypothetical protein n=1 Tax=Lactobacillus delbrueckii TaxID=1584 RepID=UPI001CD86379|nr:hypothetical protein [Lactobacillus delbrueckii]GHN45445.1 hypothetical protein ME798_09750 [Lactobacillus delbrueckii]GHN56638.1 hypothetical protein ME804_06780 [Lactobacillus delbrueckii]
MNFKKICMSGAACLAVGISIMPSVASASSNNTDNSYEQSEFIKAYNTGKEKGILTDQNMTQSEFLSLCKESVFPAYLEYQQAHPTVSFAQYVADDNYEVPRQQAGDNPITVSATGTKSSSSIFPFISFASVSARKGYSMKAGDILICYGRNITSKYIGHAAIASSSKYIMEMPGPGKHATHTPKATFFKRNSGNGKYVAVYRIKKHPHYADDASTYAYKHMYLKTNPSYFFPSSMYVKSPSYCSKYVYLAYEWGATKRALYPIPGPSAVVLPHGLENWFKGDFTPSYVYKVTSY